MAQDDTERLYRQLESGVMSSSQLQTVLRVSQPTMSRLLQRAGDRVVRIGQARARRYGLRSTTFGVDGAIPLYAVDEAGRARQLANVHGLAAGQFYIETDATRFWLMGASADGVYADLPYFLDDIRPQGFLGRQLARRYARLLSFPEDPRQWNREQIGRYLVQEAHDVSGNLLLGEQALQRMQVQELSVITDRVRTYPQLASSVLQEGQGGSSAGGEHQKFVCCTAENGHVIVKFSPAGDAVDAGRWRDLLIAEHHALQVLDNAGIASAKSELHIIDQRVYLEVRRFDRVAETGRVPMLSLSAVDAEFVGLGQDWVKVAQRLTQMQLLSAEDVKAIIWADLFGQWIANTDRHLGNLSVSVEDRRFKLLPVYDMLPMMYAPERGEIVQRAFRLPVEPMHYRDSWLASAKAAIIFWHSVMQDGRVSDDFRKTAERNADDIQRHIQ